MRCRPVFLLHTNAAPRRPALLLANAGEQLTEFWDLIDEILNAVLFLLIGVELLVIDFNLTLVLVGFVMIVLVLLARLIAVAIPIHFMRRTREFVPYTISILTWGGLRGGISIALALSLPPGDLRDAIIAVTYVAVALAIASLAAWRAQITQ